MKTFQKNILKKISEEEKQSIINKAEQYRRGNYVHEHSVLFIHNEDDYLKTMDFWLSKMFILHKRGEI